MNKNWIIGLSILGGCAALVLLLVGVTRRGGILSAVGATTQYTNAEEWQISWDEDGLPTKITVHRKATET